MHNNKHYGMKPEELILALIPRLEAIKKKQDSEELFVKKMQEVKNQLNYMEFVTKIEMVYFFSSS